MGAECLLRWTSPDLGEVSPGLFIPVAEATGLIHHIGAWVLEEACRQAVGWREQGLDPPPLAVNVFSRQLQDPGRDLAERVREELDRSTLPARQLAIEFTESCLLPASGALETMARLAAMGVSLAEGVERPEERQWLQQHGCDSFQGFLFSRPLPAEAFASLLAAPGRNLPLAAATAEPVALRPDA